MLMASKPVSAVSRAIFSGLEIASTPADLERAASALEALKVAFSDHGIDRQSPAAD
jgi:hypothetical protein